MVYLKTAIAILGYSSVPKIFIKQQVLLQKKTDHSLSRVV